MDPVKGSQLIKTGPESTKQRKEAVHIGDLILTVGVYRVHVLVIVRTTLDKINQHTEMIM